MAGEQTPLPAPPPSASLADDVYDIGTADVLELEPEATPVPGAAGPPGAESPLARTAPAQDPATGRFIKAAKEHPRYLVRQAKDLGYQDDEIAEMDTDGLGEAVAASTRFLADESRRASQRQAVDPSRSANPNPPGEAAPGPAPADAVDWGQGEDGAALAEADYSPAVARVIKSHHAQAKRLDQLETLVRQLLSAEGGRQAESAHDRLDRAFAGLTDLAATLGTGGRHELDPQGPEIARRQAVIDQAKRMAGGEKATWPQLLAKVPAAARALFGGVVLPNPERAGDAPPPAPEPELERWQQGGTARPTHRQGGAEPRGRTAAVKQVAQALRERNGAVGNTVTDADFPE